MISFIMLSSIILISYFIGRINRNKNLQYAFFDFNHTRIIKGISIILVLWAHVAQLNDVQGLQFIAGAGVSAFLICSGYGIEMSYKKNGLKAYWKKKIVNVLIPYYLISFTIYLLLHFSNIEFREIISILNLTKLWYINYQFICYTIFFCISIFVKKNNKSRIVLICFAFFIWFFIDSLFFVQEGAPFLRARQMGAFASGVIIANRKKESENIISKVWFWGGNLFCGLLFMFITYLPVVKNLNVIYGNLLSLLTTVPLAFAMISATILFKRMFQNSFLCFNGKLSYEIYLIHYPLLTLSNNSLSVLALFIAITYLGAWLFVFLYNKILEKRIIHY